MTLRIPADMNILDCCGEVARNKYQIAKTLKINYGATLKQITKLTNMELLCVSRIEKGKGPTGKVEYFLVTSQGAAILRGYKEGSRK